MNWRLLSNSLIVSGLATVLALAFGWFTALWIAGLNRRLQKVAAAFCVAALAIPPFVATNCWLSLLGETGLLRAWFPWSIFSLGGAVWILALLLWPLSTLALLAAWQRLEAPQLESDPALRGRALMSALLWPLGRGAVGGAAVLTLVLALNNFAVPTILQVPVFTEEMWLRYSTELDIAGALRAGWLLVLAPLLAVLWLSHRPLPWPHLQTPVSPALFRRQLGAGWHTAASLVGILAIGLSVGLPVVLLASAGRTWTELPDALAAGQDAVWHSFGLAALSATVVMVVSGLLLAAPKRPQGAASRWLWLPFFVPGVLLAILFIQVFNRPGLVLVYQSSAIVVLAFLVRYFGFGWNAVEYAAGKVDRDLQDAARVHGATRAQVVRYVIAPQIAPQAAAAWYLVFLLCLWDVDSLVLIMPPGGETLAVRIFNLLHYGHNAQVNALCLALLIVALLPLLAWSAWRTWPRRQRPAHLASFVCLGAGLLVLAGCSGSAGHNQQSVRSALFERVQIIGSRGNGVGQFNKPRSVAVDAQDNLYVVDMTGRVQKFDSNGVFLLQWQMPQTDKGRPKGMCRDLQGNIVVIEPHYFRVNHFSPVGTLVYQWGRWGTNSGDLAFPRAVAFSSSGDVYVSEYSKNERVQRFHYQPPPETGSNATGTGSISFLQAFGAMGRGPGQFNRPEGLCTDAHDLLYVADSCNHRVQVFAPDGHFLRAHGKGGKAKGELSYPYDICVDRAGRQYVCEFGNSRIQVFNDRDEPIEILGGPGAEPGQFSNPWGVALDSAGNLYVADSQNHRVQKFLARKQTAAGGSPKSEVRSPRSL